MASSKIEAFALSDIGLVRPNNEDVYLALNKERFFAVADGMGGHNGGEVAAKEAIGTIGSFIEKIIQTKDLSSRQFIAFLQSAIENANQKVFQLGKENQHLQGMGTTLCCLYVFEDSVIYAHVGDSRIYRYREKELKQLTQDHNLLNEMMKENESPFPLPHKNIITRAVGTSVKVQPEIASVGAKKGDIFFLCTDGLTDFVTPQEMEGILTSKRSLKKRVTSLIEKAKEKGSNDNITILMIKIKNQ